MTPAEKGPAQGDASPVNIAVVGHTNTGKTSLIRTLLRSESFGTVADGAGTTRHVERATLAAAGRDIVALFDTPGLEDSSALLAVLDKGRAEGPRQRIEEFLGHLDQHPAFNQEAKVLRQGLASDALLYVVDVRTAPLEKYRDEISILGKLGKPILPVFNFVTDHPAQLAAWRELMISHNLHAALEFDTVAFDFEAEKRLYQKLQGVLESRYEQLQVLIDARARAWQTLCEAAVRRVAALVADTATHRVAADSDRSEAAARLRDDIRNLEQACLRDLLQLFDFSPTDVALMELPVSDGAWQLDLFSPNTLRLFGLNAGSSALTGAAAGAGIDLMLGGLSLGAATALGAAVGAAYSTARRYGNDIKSSFSNNPWLCADDTTVTLVYLRGYYLLQHLVHRGHASRQALTVGEPGDAPLPDEWPSLLAGLRTGQANREDDNRHYQRARTRLKASLAAALTYPAQRAEKRGEQQL